MQTRRWLSLFFVLCALASTVMAAQALRITVDAGITHVEYAGRELVIEASAAVVVDFSMDGNEVVADVHLLDASVGSAHVRITAADDPQHIIFSGIVRDADSFEDLFFHDETGRGEQ